MRVQMNLPPLTLSLIFIATMGIYADCLAGTDEDALNLADATPVVVERVSPWRITTEASLDQTRQRYGLRDYNSARLSLDLYYDAIVSPGWRVVFGDRLDRTNRSADAGNNTVNSLKEAYVSWHPEGNNIVDAGRINARFGVATGYNPTDFFRSGALRSVTSIDPNSLRENRLGTGMVRGQMLLEGGSITAIYAPKLERTPSDAPFNADLGATNNRDRWMIVGGKQLSENFNPQFLLFGGSGQSVQAGANLTTLLNQSTVAYIEWSGGSGRSLYADATGASATTSFQQRVATGLTYTNAHKMSLTSEFEFNGAGLGKNEWATLAQNSPTNYLRYRSRIQNLLELPTKTALFFYATWQDALLNHLDLKALVRINLADHSRLNWIEARYHFTKLDLSLQVQHNGGNAFSEFGALPQRQMIQTMVTYYF